MTDKPELTAQEKELLDVFAAMLVQVVMNEAGARENEANNEKLKF